MISKSNVISAGVNSVSQFNAIKNFKNPSGIERSYLFSPNLEIMDEIRIGIKNQKLN